MSRIGRSVRSATFDQALLRVVLYIHLHQVALDAYEHPESLDVEAFVPGGTGQTGDHNSQPLGRTGHRTRTHSPGYDVRELEPGDYVWQTRHHRYRRVNHLGPTTLTEPIGSGLMSDDPVDRAVAQMTLELQLTGRTRIPAHLRSVAS